MRKFVRNQISDLLSNIWEGIKQARKLKPQDAESVLTDCYLAVQTVEKALQNGLSQDAFLKYADLLSAIKEHLEETNAEIAQGVPVSEVTKKLKSELKQLRKFLSDEEEVKIEVVFFPYKASMWDSLESIWMAALKDKNCDAYVVPVPYYDKLPNGEFGEMHYEGDLYPEYVPLVDWRVYDLEKRLPDIVFIHNPYDESNLVTSVHPDFYSKRLRKYTDMLIYSPYFVVPDDVSEHLCTTEGCIYAHKTVVQSKKICDTYIRTFEKTFGDRFGNPRGKFIPLGSPKFDKVILTKRADYAVPAEWSKKITGKKVVLYNTSIGSMLQGNEEYLAKLQNVFNLFRERTDAVLWWRPHPLAEDTLRSMRPALAELYREIVKAYRQDTFGIYDDSADVNRSIAYADYYYGDSGSAVEAAFFATGKPLMIQRLGVTDESLVLPVILGATDSALFFSPLYSTAIMRFDLISKQTHVLKPGYSTAKRPYSLGVNCDGALYLTPVASDRIFRLDMRTNSFADIPFQISKQDLPHANANYQTGMNFIRSHTHMGEIFFVGGYYPAIMCYSPGSGKIVLKTTWPGPFKAGNNGVVFTYSCQMESSIVIVGASSVLLFFNMETHQFSTECISSKCAVNGFSTIAFGDGYLWMVSKTDGTILRFDPKSKEITEYNDSASGMNRYEPTAIASIYANGYFWIFSKNANAVLRLHAASGKLFVVRKFPAMRGTSAHLSLPVLIGKKIYASTVNYPGLTAYDVETGAYEDIPIHTAQNAGDVEYFPTDIHDTIMLENGFDTIDTLIHTPAKDNRKLLADWISSSDGTAGEKIYHYAKGLVMPKQ